MTRGRCGSLFLHRVTLSFTTPRRFNPAHGGHFMNVVELQRALRQLRCSGIAAGLEVRLLEAQAEKLAAIDFLSRLVQDELVRRQDRLLERRLKQAGFRDAAKRLDTFDFDFNNKMNRALVFELATARFIASADNALLFRPPAPKTYCPPR